MKLQELTSSEQILLGSVVLGAICLTSILILCIIWKKCWIHKYLWKDEKLKTSPVRKKGSTDDIICIRYPPDIYPTSVGVYRENIIRSPEDELARLFSQTSPMKRDSTYSSMSDGSSSNVSGAGAHPYEFMTSPNGVNGVNGMNGGGYALSMPPMPMSMAYHTVGNGKSNNLSPTSVGSGFGCHSPDSSSQSPSPLLSQTTQNSNSNSSNADSSSATSSPVHGKGAHSHSNLGSSVNNNLSPPPLAPLNDSQLHFVHNNNNRTPFFTFALKFEEENGLVHIDFIEARNLPGREYCPLPSDVFFTIEIQPKRHVLPPGRLGGHHTPASSTISLASAIIGTRSFGRSFLAKQGGGRDGGDGSGSGSAGAKNGARQSGGGQTQKDLKDGGGLPSMIPPHYRFVTKTLKKVLATADFSETFLAQLSRAHMKDYFIRFTAFDQDRFGNPTELGSTTLTFDDFHDFTQHKLILSCSLKEPIIKLGEIFVGLCHLPTAERVSVSIVKVANLNPYLSHGLITKQSICYVRVLLLRADTGKVLKRKKTTYQRCLGNTSADQQPQFNETLVFDMPPAELLHSVLLVLVCITNKIPMGGSHGSTPTTGLAPPSTVSHALKRHSTPDSNNFVYPPYALGPLPQSQQQQQRERHSIAEPVSTAAAAFHYEDNLNSSSGSRLNKMGTSTTSTGSGSSCANSTEQLHDYDPSHSSSSMSKEGSGSIAKDRVVGKMALGYTIRNAKGKCHWEQMVRTPRNVISEWHTLK